MVGGCEFDLGDVRYVMLRDIERRLNGDLLTVLVGQIGDEEICVGL